MTELSVFLSLFYFDSILSFLPGAAGAWRGAFAEGTRLAAAAAGGAKWSWFYKNPGNIR
jgi:hypothetical protein